MDLFETRVIALNDGVHSTGEHRRQRTRAAEDTRAEKREADALVGWSDTAPYRQECRVRGVVEVSCCVESDNWVMFDVILCYHHCHTFSPCC